MSGQEAQAKGNGNGKNSDQPSSDGWKGEMTRQQALAVTWTGLKVLAENGQLVVFNDLKNGIAYFGIVGAKTIRTGDGKAVRLEDMLEKPTLESVGNVLAAPGSVGNGHTKGKNQTSG